MTEKHVLRETEKASYTNLVINAVVRNRRFSALSRTGIITSYLTL